MSNELWAVHAQGPDEIYPAFDRSDAERHAAELNAIPTPPGILVAAVVIPSPWPASQHWQYLAEQEREHKQELLAHVAPTDSNLSAMRKSGLSIDGDEAPSLPAAGSAELIAEAERCLFVLREIGSMDADDITGDDVDLRFEDEEGCDTGCDVSIVDYAEKSADVIEKMIAALSAQQSAQPEFCCEHSYKVAKQAAWGARDLTQCKCDHNEYCEHCWPDDFREGGKWHGGFETKQSAPERVSVPVELLERVCWPVVSGSDRHTHSEAVAELRALLASHGRGEVNG